MTSKAPGNGAVVLVTGGAGFIGSHTVDRLVAEGNRVIVLDDLSTGKRENLARWSDDPRVELVVADIADGIFAALEPATARMGPVERIVHLAAQTSVTRSLDNPLLDMRINFAGTIHVLEYARARAVKKIVFASSAAVYGDVTEDQLPVREELPCHPLSPYGVHKRSIEMHLGYYRMVHGVETTALRFFNVYGPRQDPKSPYSGVISIFSERATAKAPLTIFGDGEQTRDFVYVGDIASAIVTACMTERGNGVVCNLGTGCETSVNQLAQLIVELCESTSVISHAATRAGEILRSVANIDRAVDALGFQPKVTLREGLAQTLAWMRESS